MPASDGAGRTDEEKETPELSGTFSLHSPNLDRAVEYTFSPNKTKGKHVGVSSCSKTELQDPNVSHMEHHRLAVVLHPTDQMPLFYDNIQ